MIYEEGIWVRKSNTFYQLDMGIMSVTQPLQKLRKILMQRSIIAFPTQNVSVSEYPWRNMTVSEANERECKIETIFINGFARDAAADPTASASPRKSAWSSKD